MTCRDFGSEYSPWRSENSKMLFKNVTHVLELTITVKSLRMDSKILNEQSSQQRNSEEPMAKGCSLRKAKGVTF